MRNRFRGGSAARHRSRWTGRLALPLAFAFFILAGQADHTQAQSVGGLDLSQLQSLQRQGQAATSSESDPSQQGNVVLQPAVPPSQPLPQLLPTSRLEQILSTRAGANLQQFGYDQLGRGRTITVSQTGAVQDDYILGPGDEIVVNLRGGPENIPELRRTVDRNGQIVLPRLPPIAATGRSFGSFRQDLNALIQRAYVASEASVSVSRIRQINVLVSGEVNEPGQKQVTGLNSAMDALLLSGGVKKSGSLRNVRIQRGGREYTVDLYSVITDSGHGESMRLADGDRILVPPLGPVAAVTGLVRRPGIYEMAPRQSSISAQALLALAGGLEVSGRYRNSIMRIQPDGQAEMTPLSVETAPVRDSEILFVQLGADQTTSQASLAGGTGLAGAYTLVAGTKLSDMLKQPGALGPSPYTLFGLIVRKDPRTLLRSLIAFTPVAVLSGTQDLPLQSDDLVRPLSVNETQLLTFVVQSYLEKLAADQNAVRNPLAQASGAVNNPLAPSTGLAQSVAAAGNQNAQNTQNTQSTSNTLISQVTKNSGIVLALDDTAGVPANIQRGEISGLLNASPPGVVVQQNTGVAQNAAQNFMDRVAGAGGASPNREAPTFGYLASQLGVDPLVLVNFLIDHRAQLAGAVRGPGFYFVGPGVTLNDLVQAGGGAVNWADESGVELISTAVDNQSGQSTTRRDTLPLRSGTLASYVVRPRDQIRLPQIFSDVGIGSVTLQGEVRYAGTYSVLRGEHLSDLLVRAGGLTNTAYPYGTVFLRQSAAQIERDGYIRAASEVETQLVVAMTRVGNDKIDPTTFAPLQNFVNDLRNQQALGRLQGIVADPSRLAASPDNDPLLEAGDVIYIPQRPSTVSVIGQVKQPGSYPYRANESVEDYVQQAGGYANSAEESETYIVLPDGSARRLEKSWLHFNTVAALPPGSAIVVPRDVTPLDARQTIIDITQIISQLAVTMASVAVLSK